MITTICVCFVLLFTSSECVFRYDYTFENTDVDGWFKYHQIPATWHDAWLRCDLEGAVLASPTTTQMNLAMREVMKSKKNTRRTVYTGIHATFSKGDYFSIDGFPLTRMPVQWMPDEPDNKNNNEDCLVLAANGSLADVNCEELHPYICFKKRTSNMVLSGCGTFDQEYNLDPRTGSCYKFHNIPRNWTRAFMTCVAEGAHLAIINSETEANVLREIFEKHPQNSIIAAIPPIMREIIHIGFNDWGERGVFNTIDGQSLEKAGFSTFSEGQPDNGPAVGEYCGGMFRNGKLDDVWCHERGTFICEMKPGSLLSDEYN